MLVDFRQFFCMVRIGLAGLPWLIRWYTNKLGWVVLGFSAGLRICWFGLGWVNLLFYEYVGFGCCNSLVRISWFGLGWVNSLVYEYVGLGWVWLIHWFTNRCWVLVLIRWYTNILSRTVETD